MYDKRRINENGWSKIVIDVKIVKHIIKKLLSLSSWLKKNSILKLIKKSKDE